MTAIDIQESSEPRPSEKLLDVFEERMTDIWRRGGFDVPDPAGTARLVRLLLDREGFGPTATVLSDSGVRAEWNRVFAEERSDFLARWLGEHLHGPLLDVLGGDFTVGRALLRHGLASQALTGCERSYAYETDWSQLPFPVHDVPPDLALPAGPYACLLMSTVLHHEPDVVALLDAAAELDAERWVVVENCLDADNDEDFHLYVDEFFNRCLNTFEVPCVPQHRTVDGWRDLLGHYGTVTAEQVRRDVPGMPFPYTLFVVDR
ncbi:hypothetical protein RVR_487 [Actinacidiphila reveromycinica]|uniref:Methyltransferase n=1 Tax=Actinacidiphila reveromycinica TaxID=659352 RepID=A0A7U3VLJ6_9ACTN|nr:hypothetical protein [Streptomyces sp. SN-593]BBA95577.1 hypothetical protein RVR_487 [Streptomyces sp. SN-593]